MRYAVKYNCASTNLMDSSLNLEQKQLTLLVIAAISLILLSSYQLIAERNSPQESERGGRLQQVNGQLVLITDRDASSGEPKEKRAARLTPFFFEPVPLNSADHSLLLSLPGIGPAMADRIIQYRRQHGPLTDISQLQNISGIGEKRSAQLANYITLEQ